MSQTHLSSVSHHALIAVFWKFAVKIFQVFVFDFMLIPIRDQILKVMRVSLFLIPRVFHLEAVIDHGEHEFGGRITGFS